MTSAIVLSEQAARRLTERIRKAGEDFGRLLFEAHEARAWEPLGYATWQDYVAGEFTFTRQHSYLLLAQGRINRKLSEAGEQARVTVTEARAVSDNMTPQEIVARVEAARGPLRDKRAKRPPSLIGWLADITGRITRIEEALEAAGDDALAYLTPGDRRALERAAGRCTEFGSAMTERLSQPVSRADDWSA